MTTITVDDQVIQAVLAVSRANDAQAAVADILKAYVRQHRHELPLFEQLRLPEADADDDLASLFQRDRDSGRTIEP
jgi:Arc/MetJ family transcription regulator